jgi:hypothetical protein
MLSKCLNSRCSARFQYLGQGRLFRIDFVEAVKKQARAGKEAALALRSKACPIEHFWLCQDCAATLTIELSDGGEVRLVPYEIPARKPAVAAAMPQAAVREATAS